MSKTATRQWMVTHEWMVKPMHQTEWIERRGLLIWIAEVFTALGSGLFLVSLFMDSWWGMAAGWFMIMFLKLPIHLAYLGKPLRFYRMLPPFTDAWKTSWFARGILFSVFFGIFAFIQLAAGTSFISDLIGSAVATPIYYTFGALAGISALGVGAYGGFIMNCCKGIPFWNQGLLPAIFVLAGIADGFGLSMGIGLAGGDINLALAETGTRYLLLMNIFLIAVYLISSNYTSAVSKLSTHELLSGPEAWEFWIGIVTLGLIIPLAISIVSVFSNTELSSILLITAIVCHTVGAFALKYCLLKEGIYRPLLSKPAAY